MIKESEYQQQSMKSFKRLTNDHVETINQKNVTRCYVCMQDDYTKNELPSVNDYPSLNRLMSSNKKRLRPARSIDPMLLNSNVTPVAKSESTMIYPCLCLNKAFHKICLLNYSIMNLTFRCSVCKVRYPIQFLETQTKFKIHFLKFLTSIIYIVLHTFIFIISFLFFFHFFKFDIKRQFWEICIGILISLINFLLLFFTFNLLSRMITEKKLEPSLFYSLKNFADDEFVVEKSKGEDMYQYLKIRHQCEKLALIEMKLNNIIFMETFHKPQNRVSRLISGNNLTFRKSSKGLGYNLFNPNCLDQDYEQDKLKLNQNEIRHKVIRNTYSMTSSRINKKMVLPRNSTSQANTNITKNEDLREKLFLMSKDRQTISSNKNTSSLRKSPKHSSTLPSPNDLGKNSTIKSNKLNAQSLHNIEEEKPKDSFNSSPAKMSKFTKLYKESKNEENLNELVDFIDRYENLNLNSPTKKVSFRKDIFLFSNKKILNENDDKGFLMLRENFKQIDEMEKQSNNEENINIHINSQWKMNNLNDFTLGGLDKRNGNEMERIVININKNNIFEREIE